jgi:hypothetical protein
MRAVKAIEWTVATWPKCYLWTFTSTVELRPDQVSSWWNVLAMRMKRMLSPKIGPTRWLGIRVYEIHPGGHGVHVHVITPMYWDAKAVWRCVGHDFGRVDVQSRPWPPAKGAAYITAYLGKYRFRTAHRLPKRTRVWASFGPVPGKRRCIDVEVRSAVTILYAYLKSQDWALPGYFEGRVSALSAWGRIRACRRFVDHPECWHDLFPASLVRELLEMCPGATQFVDELGREQQNLAIASEPSGSRACISEMGAQVVRWEPKPGAKRYVRLERGTLPARYS